MSVIFLFLDGVGLAPAGVDNPLRDANTPYLHTLLGGPLTAEHVQQRDTLLLKPIDATLGVAGLPQSGTGHCALLLGLNAPHMHGRHQPHFPPVALRPLLASQSLFHLVQKHGGHAAFANAFSPEYWQALDNRRIRRSASVIAAQGASLEFRGLDALAEGQAISWDITGRFMRGRPPEWPLVAPTTAGAQLAALASRYELVFFECFLPDLAGHGRLSIIADSEAATPRAQVHAAFALIDGLIGGILAALRPQDTLLITSDHGNCESLSAPAHTRNPVPLLAAGAHTDAFHSVEDISQIASVITQ